MSAQPACMRGWLGVGAWHEGWANGACGRTGTRNGQAGKHGQMGEREEVGEGGYSWGGGEVGEQGQVGERGLVGLDGQASCHEGWLGGWPANEDGWASGCGVRDG